MPSLLSPLRTALKLTAGFVLLAIGLLLSLPGVPGPGIVVILLGLWILSGHFEWARRMLAWSRERVERLKRKGRRAGRDGDGGPPGGNGGETEAI